MGPCFAAWGLWHDGDAAKPEAVRPVGWILAHAPELRVRALVGPTLEDDLLAAALLGLPAPLLSDSHPRCGRRTTASPPAKSPGRSACPTRRPTRAPINWCGAVRSAANDAARARCSVRRPWRPVYSTEGWRAAR